MRLGCLLLAQEWNKWRFHDNFFVGEPFGGRAVVFLKGRPVWLAVFYGWVAGTDAEVQPVYAFLQRALRLAPEHLPFRGLDEFSDRAFTYRNALHGHKE